MRIGTGILTMSLSISPRTSGDVLVLDMSGRLSALELLLREKVHQLLEQGCRFFVLNLSGVSYVDSSGLGQMVSVWTSVRNRGGSVVFLQPAERLTHLLEITKLNTVFEIFQDEETAVRAVGHKFAYSA